MMHFHYILDEQGDPVAVDLMTWAEWMGTAERHVGDDHLANGAHISTVFLGLDHNWGSGPPVLWETMIFGGPHDEYQERYSSREEAIAGHKRAVELASTNGEE